MAASLADLLLGPAPAGAPPELVHCEGETSNREQVAGAARELAEQLRAAGVAPGRPVAGLLPTDATAVAAMFGVWAAGAVFVPVNPRLADDEVAAIFDDVRPAAVVAPPDVLDGRASLMAGLALLAAESLGWEVQSRAAPTETGAEAADPDVALVLYTSGTTGRPKAVSLRHGATIEGIDTVLGTLSPTGAKRSDGRPRRRMPNLVPFPLSLWSGIYNTCFAFRVGSPVILMPTFRPEAFAEVVRRFELTSTVLAPAMVAMVADDPRITDLSPLRFVRSITAALSPHQARRFHDRFGVAVLNSYGQTELGGEVIGWSGADVKAFGQAKLGALGRPHAGIDVRFTDEGELCVRSPYMMKGYLSGDVATRLTEDGYLRTGDIGSMDEEGFVWLSGRVSDVINRGGLKVFPADVEEVLLHHDDVRDVAVVGAPDERLGEVPWAFVVAPTRQDGDGLAVELDQLARRHLAPYRVPTRMVLVDELPRNDVGKVVRHDLVAAAADPA